MIRRFSRLILYWTGSFIFSKAKWCKRNQKVIQTGMAYTRKEL